MGIECETEYHENAAAAADDNCLQHHQHNDGRNVGIAHERVLEKRERDMDRGRLILGPLRLGIGASGSC